MQREDMDFIETLAAVTHFQSITCLIPFAAYYGLKLEQMDEVTHFLNSDGQGKMYIEVLRGLEIPYEFKEGTLALRVLKGLHSVTQTRRLWND